MPTVQVASTCFAMASSRLDVAGSPLPTLPTHGLGRTSNSSCGKNARKAHRLVHHLPLAKLDLELHGLLIAQYVDRHVVTRSMFADLLRQAFEICDCFTVEFLNNVHRLDTGCRSGAPGRYSAHNRWSVHVQLIGANAEQRALPVINDDLLRQNLSQLREIIRRQPRSVKAQLLQLFAISEFL